MFVDLTWADFKTTVGYDKTAVRYYERETTWYLTYKDFETAILKDDSVNIADFETNYKSYANRPIPTTITTTPFASKTLGTKNLFKRVVGIRPALTTGLNTVVWSCPYNWAKFMSVEIIGAELGDYVTLKVLDTPGGLISGVPNYPLNTFGTTVNIAKDHYLKESKFDADIYLGIQMELTIYSVSEKTIGINFDMNEVK